MRWFFLFREVSGRWLFVPELPFIRTTSPLRLCRFISLSIAFLLLFLLLFLSLPLTAVLIEHFPPLIISEHLICAGDAVEDYLGFCIAAHEPGCSFLSG